MADKEEIPITLTIHVPLYSGCTVHHQHIMSAVSYPYIYEGTGPYVRVSVCMSVSICPRLVSAMSGGWRALSAADF